jgi:hypothetical protein
MSSFKKLNFPKFYTLSEEVLISKIRAWPREIGPNYDLMQVVMKVERRDQGSDGDFSPASTTSCHRLFFVAENSTETTEADLHSHRAT